MCLKLLCCFFNNDCKRVSSSYMCSYLIFSDFVLIAIPVGLVYIFLMIHDSEHFLALLLVLLVFLFFCVCGEGGNVYSTYCPWSNWVVLALMSYMSS